MDMQALLRLGSGLARGVENAALFACWRRFRIGCGGVVHQVALCDVAGGVPKLQHVVEAS